MKRSVWVFGLIAGLIVSTFMVITVAICCNNPDYQGNMALGYASMVAAFAFVYVGIKSYRDRYNQGVISFLKALQVGALITLVASTVYVVVWLVDYYLFFPDFMDKYTAHVLKQTRADGIHGAELSKQIAEMNSYKEMYKNPLLVILLTYTEVLPVGLIITLISALILKKNNTSSIPATA